MSLGIDSGRKRLMDIDRLEPAPTCPSCGRPMRLARAIGKTGAQPELAVYECQVCGVMMTVAKEPRRESA